MCALALVATGLVAEQASATLPGRNGPLLISAFVKNGSPNYTTFLFTQEPGAKAKKIAGAPEKSAYDGAVSPNGRQLVYSSYPGYQLWLGPLSRPGKARAITDLDPELNNGDSVFAPDGKSIFYSATYFTGAGVGWHLRRYDLKTKKIRSYKVDPKQDWGLTDVSPNGRLVAYNRGDDDHKSEIRFLDVKTGKSRAFSFRYPTGGASFSPDGRKIAFTAMVKGSPQVFIAGLNGKGAKKLTSGRKINYYPVFSPDGRQIAFTQGGEAVKRVGVITLRTGKIRYFKAPGDYAEVEQWLSR